MTVRLRWALLCLFSCFLPGVHAQNAVPDEHLRVSVLTCSVGDELYASFGHTAIRITDSLRGTDAVYNYGTFDFSDPDFYSKFTLGKLLYFLDKEDFRNFVQNYRYEQRGIKEQVLQLGTAEKKQVLDFLETNLLPANRAYHYDFLKDNCATRVCAIFPRILGADFAFGPVLNERISYRAVINRYLADKYWERLGIDLILGSPVDQIMTDKDALFLPDYCFKALQGATYHGNLLAVEQHVLPEKEKEKGHRVNEPLVVLLLLLVVFMISTMLRPLKQLRNILTFLLLFISGLLGLQLLFMWWFTDHQSCNNNWNVLWAMPLNIGIAFITHKRNRFLKGYALFAATFLIAAVAVHFSGIQELPLLTISPLLLCLLMLYGHLYIKQKTGTG